METNLNIMETKKTPQSVKIIYWITQGLFWLFSVSAILAVFFAIALLFNLLQDVKLNIGLPVEAHLVESGTYQVGSELSEVKLKEMIGKLEFEKVPSDLKRLYGFYMIIALCITFYLFLTFRNFIIQVYKGLYFDRKNIMLLKRIAYGLLGMWIFIVFYGYFQYFVLVKNLQFESVEFMGKVETYPAVLISALLVWVLSHIFQKGVEIETENELTI